MFREKDIGPDVTFFADVLALPTCSSTLSIDGDSDSTLLSYNKYCLLYRDFEATECVANFHIFKGMTKENISRASRFLKY